MSGYWEEMSDFYKEYTKGLDFNTEEYKEAFKRSNKAYKDWIGEKYKEYKKAHKGKKIVTLEFSDNDGSLNASIEHGDLFSHLDSMRISHH